MGFSDIIKKVGNVVAPLSGVGLIGGLLGGGRKVPGIDTGALQRLSEAEKKTQIDLLAKKKAALAPLAAQYRTDRAGLSAQIEPGAENLITKYGQDLSGVGAREKAASEAAITADREQNFRDVPEIQRAIRSSLGGSGLLSSGAARGQIAQPTIDAARSSRDFSSGLNVIQLGNEARRNEGLATTGFNTRNAALNSRLGVDENTLNSLANMGRTDLIDEYASLARIEGDAGNNALQFEQLRQSNDIEQAKAAQARRGQILSTLGSLGGMALGSFGGPVGAGIGGQIGGSLGNIAGGGSGGSIDPTLLFALAQQNRNNTRGNLSNPTTNRFDGDFRNNIYGTR